MTGGIAGGGFGAFWSLFVKSDIPRAIASMGNDSSQFFGLPTFLGNRSGKSEKIEPYDCSNSLK
jgi:hypothetical protein